MRRLAGNVEIHAQADGDWQVTHTLAAVPLGHLAMHALAKNFAPLVIGFRKQDEKLMLSVPDDIIGATRAGFQGGGKLPIRSPSRPLWRGLKWAIRSP
jgi:hypothetical protein